MLTRQGVKTNVREQVFVKSFPLLYDVFLSFSDDGFHLALTSKLQTGVLVE